MTMTNWHLHVVCVCHEKRVYAWTFFYWLLINILCFKIRSIIFYSNIDIVNQHEVESTNETDATQK